MKRITAIILAVLCLVSAFVPANAGNIDISRYGIFQTALIKRMGGDVKGFGMLAKYDTPPESFYIKREAVSYTNPYYDEAIVRVFDPDGFLKAQINMPDVATYEAEIPISDGKIGIWRISVSGGNNGDTVTLGLPSTDIWGIRGEMTLGMTENTLHEGYMYMAKTTNYENRDLWHNNVLPSGFLFGEATGNAVITVSDLKGNFICKTETNGKRKNFMLDPVTEGEILKIKIDGNGGGVAFDGTPGLLCPTKKAAEELKGGTVKVSNGFCFAGPLQAAIYEHMVELSETKNFDVSLDWPSSIPENADLMHEVLFFGKYSPISDIELRLDNQIFDKNNPYFGQIIADDGTRWSSAGGLATAATQQGELNPAYQNEAIINRAILNGLSEILYTQGDGISRNKDTFQNSGYPFSGFFFFFSEHLTATYLMLKDYLDEKTDKLWRAMMLDIGDKAAYVRCYQSNQWAFMIDGHLNIYLATGEERFLRYFKTQMKAFLDNDYGPSSKMGQHPAGYFLEEYGPDGNYQSLNLFVIVGCYNKYKQISTTDEMYKKLKNGIEKALYFNSFYWLKQPDGTIYSPTHMNGRTTSAIGTPSYPGDYMAKAEFPLGYTRWLMNEQRKENSGFSSSSQVTNEEWAKHVINSLISTNGSYDTDKWDMFQFIGLFEAFAIEQEVDVTEIPADSNNSVWTLPGQNAWKKGGIYGLVFYDVAGSTYSIPKTILGGAPSVLWSKGTGITLCSLCNENDRSEISTESDLSYSAVYKYNDGKILVTGKNHPAYSGTPENFTITEAFDESNVEWNYKINEEYTEINVSYGKDETVYLNLPFLNHSTNQLIYFADENTLMVRYKDSVMEFKGVKGATLSEDIAVNGNKIKRLSIPFNKKVSIKVKAYNLGYIRNNDYIIKSDFNDNSSLSLFNLPGLPEIENGWLKMSYNSSNTGSNSGGRCANKVKIDAKGIVRLSADFMFEDDISYVPKRNLLVFGKNNEYESPFSYGLSTGGSQNLYFYNKIIDKVEPLKKYNLELVVDFNQRWCTGYLNNQFVGTHQLQKSIDGIDIVRFVDAFGSSHGKQKNYVDNLAVCNVEEVKTYANSFTVEAIELYKGESRAVTATDTDKIKLSLNNLKESGEEINIYVGMYKNNMLYDIVCIPYNSMGYEVNEIENQISVPSDADKLICFIWNKNTSEPYITKYILN